MTQQTRIPRTHLRIFAKLANTARLAQFGSSSNGGTQYTKDINTLQSLPAYGQGWENTIQSNSAPIIEEVNGMWYLLTNMIAYLNQQEGIGVEYNKDTTYYNGSFVSKIASSPLLGDHASKVTLVYRSLEDDNLGNALPNDFITDDHWAFVDAVQPQSLNKLDFSGHVGEVRTTTAEENNIPINWGICDGRAITMTDGTTQETPDLRDKFLISASKGKVKGTSGGSWNHSTDGHQLNVDQIPAHSHFIWLFLTTQNISVSGGHGGDTQRTMWSQNKTTNATGGNQSHSHEMTNITSPYYTLYYITRMF